MKHDNSYNIHKNPLLRARESFAEHYHAWGGKQGANMKMVRK